MRKCCSTLMVVLLLTGWAGLASAAEPAPKKIRAVLWLGGGMHDDKGVAKILVEALPKLEPMEIEIVWDGKFLDAPTARQLDLILMHHCFADPKADKSVVDDAQRQKLLDVVRGGVGVVALHGSYYSFLSWKEFHELFGTQFVRHGDSKSPLVVRITDDKHPITKGLPATFEVWSELYESKPLAEDCHVLAMAKQKDKDVEHPSVWTRSYGKGRVVTILPAHFPKSYKIPEFQKLIAASARWAARQ